MAPFDRSLGYSRWLVNRLTQRRASSTQQATNSALIRADSVEPRSGKPHNCQKLNEEIRMYSPRMAESRGSGGEENVEQLIRDDQLSIPKGANDFHYMAHFGNPSLPVDRFLKHYLEPCKILDFRHYRPPSSVGTHGGHRMYRPKHTSERLALSQRYYRFPHTDVSKTATFSPRGGPGSRLGFYETAALPTDMQADFEVPKIIFPENQEKGRGSYRCNLLRRAHGGGGRGVPTCAMLQKAPTLKNEAHNGLGRHVKETMEQSCMALSQWISHQAAGAGTGCLRHLPSRFLEGHTEVEAVNIHHHQCARAILSLMDICDRKRRDPLFRHHDADLSKVEAATITVIK
ncbi:hypothetical protein NPX13_g4788 [Xylaria arbuscula]|uniref:Uncharacterized protein n=1 Tax=Xylaria arbuscula TaxID=114810 RepID=A0A9W8NFN7_9PEZI|nr:hypothetical protein NPX13_g4788 [Xylaria arbuscula]